LKNIPTPSDSQYLKKWKLSTKRAGFGLILIYCFLCSIYTKTFAQLNVRLPFLDFPIFTGEILIGICIVLFGFYRMIERPKFSIWDAGVLGIVGWILIKAIHGYWIYGPLALRNAALFYYVLFAFLGYHFFRNGVKMFKFFINLSFILRIHFFYKTNRIVNKISIFRGKKLGGKGPWFIVLIIFL